MVGLMEFEMERDKREAMSDYFSFDETNLLNDDKGKEWDDYVEIYHERKKKLKNIKLKRVKSKIPKTDLKTMDNIPDKKQDSDKSETKYRNKSKPVFEDKSKKNHPPTTKSVSNHLNSSDKATTTKGNVQYKERVQTKPTGDKIKASKPEINYSNQATNKDGKQIIDANSSITTAETTTSKVHIGKNITMLMNDTTSTESYFDSTKILNEIEDRSLFKSGKFDSTIGAHSYGTSAIDGVYIGKGTLIGVCAGAAALIVVVAIIIYLLVRKKQRQSPITNEMYIEYKIGAKMAVRAPIPEPRESKPSSSSGDLYVPDGSIGWRESCVYDSIQDKEEDTDKTIHGTESTSTDYIEFKECPKYDYVTSGML